MKTALAPPQFSAVVVVAEAEPSLEHRRSTRCYPKLTAQASSGVLRAMLGTHRQGQPVTVRASFVESYAQLLGVEISLGPGMEEVTDTLCIPAIDLERALKAIRPGGTREVALDELRD